MHLGRWSIYGIFKTAKNSNVFNFGYGRQPADLGESPIDRGGRYTRFYCIGTYVPVLTLSLSCYIAMHLRSVGFGCACACVCVCLFVCVFVFAGNIFHIALTYGLVHMNNGVLTTGCVY